MAQPLRWKRFREIITNSYSYTSNYYADAVALIPKRDIWFFGFGLCCNYHSKDTKMKVRWCLGKDGTEFESEWYEVDLVHEERDTENHWHTIDIRELGEKPMKVSEGTWIHLLVMNTSDDYEQRRYWYGNYGSKHYYSTFEGQEYDFDTDYSRFSDNGTNYEYGQFPFIYYA